MTQVAIGPGGVAIAYERLGEGPPVILIHGFGGSRFITWGNTGWYEFLIEAGYSVIALDCRGHGESGKPHAKKDYHDKRMAGDAVAVMDAEGIEKAHVVGYSMGAYLSVALLFVAPARIASAVLAGVGETFFTFWGPNAGNIAEGLLAKDPETIEDDLAADFRGFSERAGNDLKALAACIRRKRLSYKVAALAKLPHPVLVVAGEEDSITGRPEPLAALFGNGRAVMVPKRSHHTTVGDPVFKDAVRDFLAENR